MLDDPEPMVSVQQAPDHQVLLQDVQEETLQPSQTRCKQAPCTLLPTRTPGVDILFVCIKNKGSLPGSHWKEVVPYSNSGAASTLKEVTPTLSPNTHVCITNAALFSKQ